jgi:hypothetical protein
MEVFMKKLLALPLLAFMIVPAMAGTHSTRYGDDSWDSEKEAQEYNDEFLTDEEIGRNREEQEDARIDYTDRTRTDRARKALNTGSDASDDN